VVSGATRGGGVSGAGAISSVAIQSSRASPGELASSGAIALRTNRVVSTSAGRASSTIAIRRRRLRSSRPGSGGYAGTATTGPSRQPKKPQTYSMPGG
jgi:hypothetical protein